MKNKKILMLLALLILVLVGSSIAYNQMKDQIQPQGMMTVDTMPSEEPQNTMAAESSQETSPSATEQEMPPAPDFTVYDPEGNPVKLSDLRGKPVIINFWATWCGYCVQEMPDFQKVYEEYGDQIHFMMINVTDGYQETKEKAEDFVAQKGFTFPVYYDLELSAASAYGVNAMPVTYLFDAEGMFVAWQQGALNEEVLRKGVGMLLEEE